MWYGIINLFRGFKILCMNYELITFLSCDFLNDEELLCCDNFDLHDYNQTVFGDCGDGSLRG